MRILTVRQPWAYAIIHLGKDVENRTRNIAGDYRGQVAIHAGITDSRWEWKPLFNTSPSAWGRAMDVRESLIYGAIIGVAELVDVLPPSYYDNADRDEAWCSEWAEPGHYQLVLANPRPLLEPIPYKGALGLRTLPAEVEALIWARLEAS